ncbi:MAG: short-chain dehydrogenase [Candidatus Entotheonella factor]|uniref:Short-chain dehydrogenase n=1 Tax=Entotheonella factor TaxID=1429438 RepID=W4L3L9_ENTF1|nr:MAG: short-chain dehydrogenase [Candidatus Entotheonella factor]
MASFFSSRTAVITGASSGIGRALALSLAQRGAHLALLGRSIEALAKVAAQARTTSAHVVDYAADFGLDREMSHAIEHIQRDFEGIDILIHSAGTLIPAPLETTAIGDFDRQYQINVRAPHVLTQAFLPTLKASQGQVVFINSSVGQHARATVGPYAASKHALKALADSLRDEVNADGIRVLSIYLGRTASPLQEQLHREEGRPYQPERLIQPEDVAAVVLNALSLPRTAEVTDIHMRPFLKPL